MLIGSDKVIIAAAKRSDETALKHYVERLNISLTTLDHESKQTVAHIAARNNNLNILKYALANDNSILEFSDIEGNTALHIAAENGALDIVKYLVDEQKADVLSANKAQDKNTAFHMAAAHGHTPVVKYLVEEKQIDANLKNEEGKSPIFLAAEQPHMETVKYLVEQAKANVTFTDEKGENILYVSGKAGDLQVPKYLLDELKIVFDINWQDLQGYTLVHVVARYGHLDTLRYLVEEKGADISPVNGEGWTALHEAAEAGHMELIQYLVSRGADIESKNKQGKLPSQVTADRSIKQYLRGELNKKRGRRSVSEPFFSKMRLRLPEMTNENLTPRVEGNENRFTDTELSSFHVQSILILANIFVKSARPSETIFSPFTLLRDRMDPLAIDVVDDTSYDR